MVKSKIPPVYKKAIKTKYLSSFPEMVSRGKEVRKNVEESLILNASIVK